jgi:hypothetical protein
MAPSVQAKEGKLRAISIVRPAVAMGGALGGASVSALPLTVFSPVGNGAGGLVEDDVLAV